MARLLLLFIVVPVIELALLIQLGQRVGLVPTLGLIVFTGALGAFLARRQGMAVIGKVRAEMADGRIPAGPIVDGVIILVAGAVLMTPGVLTDLFGFLCLVPAFRGWLKRFLRRRFEGALRSGRASVAVDFGFGSVGASGAGRREVRDVTPRDATPSDGQRLEEGDASADLDGGPREPAG